MSALRRLGLAAGTTSQDVRTLLANTGLTLCHLADLQPIPGSYWGAPEAGLRGAVLYARTDTPLHSVLHEASHYICMDAARRAALDTDAGGDDLEECAVCYLSILLAEAIPGFGRAAMFGDMDLWGYSFRLGSAREWFERDAADALAWLRVRGFVERGSANACRLLRSGCL